jgi:hypothetical protein
MKSRLVRGSAVVLLVLAMAVTPLSVVFSAGRFETWLPSWNVLGRANAHVVLDDQTGMVRAISVAGRAAGPGDLDTVVNPAGNRYVLQVTWGDSSCVREAHLGFRRSEDGYVLEQRTLARSCGHLDLTDYSVAVHLWSPIDANSVTFNGSTRPSPGLNQIGPVTPTLQALDRV